MPEDLHKSRAGIKICAKSHADLTEFGKIGSSLPMARIRFAAPAALAAVLGLSALRAQAAPEAKPAESAKPANIAKSEARPEAKAEPKAEPKSRTVSKSDKAKPNPSSA